MLIGAHVSTAGGLANAVERGIASESDAIHVFNQSPRMWRPTNYADDDFAAFRASFAESRMQQVVIHAVYLINCASKEPEIRKKSIASLTHACGAATESAPTGSCSTPARARASHTAPR